MFLRSLTLKGFKSFAEPTVLEFEPGLTVVVGPNGSGKSNVVDAVAWVLGAQGPRALRSQKMEDVIFAGNGGRAPSGRAEVTLTIDNSAGILPIGFTEVTITRVLWRSSGESEYSINGVPCRLLDVQELLSDSGVGRQQHVIVSQGNLDAVLDARPEERRLVIEEAAGILKFRRRKEKAQRRLDASEANLLRLTDLLKELRRQMRPLERQAEAARRHDDLAAELAALRLHLTGRAIAGLHARVEAAARARNGAGAEEARVRAALRSLDESVAAAESRLTSANRSELADVAGRLEALRERGRGQAALLADRVRALAAELAAAESSEVVARLEADAATLAAQLVEVEAHRETLQPEAAALAAAEAALAHRREALAVRTAREQEAERIAEARGELAAVAVGAERGRAEVAALAEQVGVLARGEDEAAAVLVAAREAAAGAAGVVAERKAAVVAAEASRAEAEQALARAVQDAGRAAAARSSWEARVEGLTAAVAGPAAGEAVAARPEVLGTLLELVEIEPGWEPAVEAALGEAVGALVVDGAASARDLLGRGLPGLRVLPVAGGAGDLPPPSGGPGEAAAAGAARPVRSLVAAADPRVGAVLDTLLVGYVATEGWAAAVDLVLAAPGSVVVSARGDRFGPSGWRLAGEGDGMAAALATARAEVATAAEQADVAAAAEHDARRALDALHEELVARRAALGDAEVVRAQRADELREVESTHRHAAAERAATERAHERRAARLAEEEARIAEVEQWLADLVGAAGDDSDRDAAAAVFTGDVRVEREEVAQVADDLATRRAGLAARTAELSERHAQLNHRLTEVERRAAAARSEQAQAQERASRRRVVLAHTRHLARWLDERLLVLDEHLDDLRTRRQRHAEWVRALVTHLDDQRQLRADTERRLEETRERGRRAEIDEAEGRMRLDAAVDTLRQEHGCEPEVAVAAACPELPPGTSAPSRVRELERELRLLGPVNPLAVEELAALAERHEFVTAQLDDVKESRRELTKIIRSVEAEMTTLLAAAYADVADNFALLFHTLFPGGEGRLRLTDPDHLLESGIEVEARPGGKNPRKLSLLSGGERSLCALAFLFAVFRSRPSPFYLLDEVEAALDDVNLHRFLRLLDEFRDEAQLLVVTHQKRTMEAADCLYGVTMAPGGSSKVISERVTAGA